MNEIEKFINRVQKSTKAKSREIRLTISEAQILSNEMAKLLIAENKLLKQIVDIQNEQSKVVLSDNEAVMDGGKFKS